MRMEADSGEEDSEVAFAWSLRGRRREFLMRRGGGDRGFLFLILILLYVD